MNLENILQTRKIRLRLLDVGSEFFKPQSRPLTNFGDFRIDRSDTKVRRKRNPGRHILTDRRLLKRLRGRPGTSGPDGHSLP